jgi:transposase-like protein
LFANENSKTTLPPFANANPYTSSLRSAGAKMRKYVTSKQEIILAALVAESSVEKAARAAKVSRATVYRWLDDADFKIKLKEQRDVLLETAVESIKCRAAKAVEKLAALMDSKDERTRRLACKDLIDYALRIKEVQSIEDRLVAMEKTLNECARKNPE